MARQGVNLVDAEASLVDAISNNAVLIYYNHSVQHFMYYIGSDKEHFHEELKTVRRNIRARYITAVSVGETLNVGGTDLFPLELRIDAHPCYEYMLLRRRGLIDDAEITPYFFRSVNKRDEVITWLKK